MKKKILIMQPELCVGGVEKVLLTLLYALDRNKYEISLVLRNPSLWDSRIPDDINVKYLFSKSPRNGNRLFAKLYKYGIAFLPGFILQRILNLGKHDVFVSFHEPMIYFLKGVKGKKIAWIHADYAAVKFIPEIKELKRKNGFLAKLIMESRKSVHDQCDQIVCVANSARNGFINKFNHKKSNVIFRYNPQESEEILSNSTEAIEFEIPNKTTFCTVGRFSYEKAYYRVVDAAYRLKMEGYDFNILMVGDGPEFIEIKESIKNKNLKEVFYLVGYQKNPYKYIAKSDCLLSTSLFEAFSTVVCESMILGVPIITTKCSGMAEIIGGTDAGSIIENNDISLYVEMKRVLDDDALLGDMKSATLERRDFFNKNIAVLNIEAVFDNI